MAMIKNPTKLTWQHDGRNTDGSQFGAASFAGWEIEIDGEVGLSIPAGWETDGNYELPLNLMPQLSEVGSHNVRMRLVANAANGTDTVASEWSNAASYAMSAVPTAPFGLAVAE